MKYLVMLPFLLLIGCGQVSGIVGDNHDYCILYDPIYGDFNNIQEEELAIQILVNNELHDRICEDK